MDPATITKVAIQLLSGDTPVEFQLAYENQSNTAVLTPNGNFQELTLYTVKTSTELTDLIGNHLEIAFESDFTTGRVILPRMMWDQHAWDNARWYFEN